MTLKNKVESILFALGKKIHVEDLCKQLGAKPSEIKKVLKELQKDYEDRGGAVMLTGFENVWKLNVREKYLSLVSNLIFETELDRQTMETLAIIAFRSPALQSDIIKKRGVGAYEHIKELEEFGFITKEKFGRTRKIRLAQKFYEYFELDEKQVQNLFNQFEEVDESVEAAEKELTEKFNEKREEEKQIKKERKEKEKQKVPIRHQLDELEGVEPGSQVDIEDTSEWEDMEAEEKPKRKEN